MKIIAVKNDEASVWEVSVAAAAEEEGWNAIESRTAGK